MKMIITLILCFFFQVLTAPPNHLITIIQEEPICIYDVLVKAIVQVESSGNRYAFNEKEGAYGCFQIRECRLKDYNAVTGLKLTLNDMYDYEISRKVFLFYTKGRSFEIISRAWCSGESGKLKYSQAYWDKVKQLI
jgi:hypothetical protein